MKWIIYTVSVMTIYFSICLYGASINFIDEATGPHLFQLVYCSIALNAFINTGLRLWSKV